jgi:drug/metabolite transporter (DMT)-like permease
MRRVSKGIQYMLLSTICFALIGLIVKLLIHIPPAEIIFLDSLVALGISCFIIGYQKIPLWGNHRKLLLLRGLSAGLGVTLFFITLVRLPLSAANVLQNTSPIFTAILGIFMLHEAVSSRRWFFFMLTFVGVGMTYMTDFSISDQSGYIILLGLISAFLMGISNNFNAKMRDGEHPLIIFSYSTFCTVLITGCICFYNFIPLTIYDFLLLLAMGTLTFIAQYLAIKAFQNAPVAHVSAISYLGIPYALIIDLLLGEKFHWISFTGMCLVIVGVILNLFYGYSKKTSA